MQSLVLKYIKYFLANLLNFGDKVAGIQQIVVKQRTENMPIAQVFNRDVFILIDRSGSMTIKDGTTGERTRWQYLQETVRGHVYEILNIQDDEYGEICNELTLYFFNANKPAQAIIIRDGEQVQSKFKEKVPGGETFIGPTLEEALNQWFANRQDNKNAFIIIYTDGELSDRKRFVDLISSTCSRINSQDEIKILLIGIGSEIQLEGVIDFYLGIDLNVRAFKSRRGEDCNIFVFDLIDDVVDEGIVAALERQLEDDPRKGLASWVKDRYPNLYKKYFGP